MSIESICDNLLASDTVYSDSIEPTIIQLTEKVRNGKLKVIDIVKSLDPVLINTNHEIRLRGVELLTRIIISQKNNFFLEKEIEVLSEFLCLRLIDHKSMEQPTLRCLSYFVDCENKPARFDTTLMEFFKGKANTHKMDSKSRLLVYEIIRKVIVERRQKSSNIDSDLIYSLVQVIEGESNPRNLLTCFSIVNFIMKNFNDLEPFIDDLFEWLVSYYPIDYSPNEKDLSESQDVNISRSDLVHALYDCFYANELNAENLQTLLLEKLESNMMSTKLESLHCLIKCYEIFPLKSVKDYATSLWTSIRVECLKKRNSVDPNLMEVSNKALSALTTNLAEDNEVYFTFISELYDELSIAFRKPEMDLFESAAMLLTSAIRPKVTGFDYVLSKILPITINATKAKEYRPLTGVAHTFEVLSFNHLGTKLSPELNNLSSELALLVVELVDTVGECLKLLNSMFRYRINFEGALDCIIMKLLSKVQAGFESAQESLALICISYQRSDILFDGDKKHCHIASLIKLVSFYKFNEGEDIKPNDSMLVKFSIYLRQLVLQLDNAKSSTIDELNQQELNEFLIETRKLATKVGKFANIVDNVGRTHAIIINKISDNFLNPIMMEVFKSDYCQSLITSPESDLQCQVYIPVLQWILKSVVIRNQQFSLPLINLILNFICSEKVDTNSALFGAKTFSIIHTEDNLVSFRKELDYHVFTFHKQKFFSQAMKEIRIRYEIQGDKLKKHILICLLAIQIPLVPPAAYRRDCEWILRESLKILITLKSKNDSGQDVSGNLISMIYDCIESLVEHDSDGKLFGLLSELIELNLSYAREAKSLLVRRRALASLAKIAVTYKEQDLLNLRSSVINQLKQCLEDKKRIVRQAAAEATLRWVLIGQPVGPTN